ncbi:MAG: helix-turn-helix domain-containing protein [Candidatus Andeanibacterium colombiense]|uniref:Helix-turn-helix domain-containing protein n=1 Tax=Candidatus Andeanibacterium colombiense TaxID=3121345 RepID=A0AAJ6BN23_9SPHN|nr:MAG: helix-turn-helix domain-containing protein [Sphingomonadaceae bacterium]
MSRRDQERPLDQAAFLSNDQAASFLNLSPRTLEKLRVIGGGPVFSKLGRRVVYAFDDLQSWASARRCSSTSDKRHLSAQDASARADQ